MVLAVTHCHKHDVAHRDIKLENWLLINGCIKLSDFGLSIIVNDNNWYVRDTTGTDGYMSPEAVNGRKRAYDARSADAWSTSVCLFTMLSGFFPYKTADISDTRFKTCYRRCDCLMTKVYSMYGLSTQAFSTDIKHLLHNSLCVRLQDRLSMNDMEHHAWNHEEVTSENEMLDDTIKCLNIKIQKSVNLISHCLQCFCKCCQCLRSYYQIMKAYLTAIPNSAVSQPVSASSVTTKSVSINILPEKQKHTQRYTRRPQPS